MKTDNAQSSDPNWRTGSTIKQIRRFDIKKLLANPELRRHLVVSGTVTTQAREGITVTRDEAEACYYVVTEGERATFFDLKRFDRQVDGIDLRHQTFVENIHKPQKGVIFSATIGDFNLSEFSALTYAEIEILGALFRESVALDKHYADVRGGMNSTESARFVRLFWELSPISRRRWVKYCKGGDYSRFYADTPLALDWTDDGRELKAIIKTRYGSVSRFIKSPEFYFKKGITWTEKSSLGFSARLLEEGAIFNVAGPCAFPRKESDRFYLLGILNSSAIAYAARAISGRNFGSNYIARIPIPSATKSDHAKISQLAHQASEIKREWDTGNEISRIFDRPWLLKEFASDESTLSLRLQRVLLEEERKTLQLRELHASLDQAVSGLFGLSHKQVEAINEQLGYWPRETIWSTMEGKEAEQKRREHVDRLLCYLVKQMASNQEDGILCLEPIGPRKPLIEKLRSELSACFPNQDSITLQTELANELKRKTKGYRRAETIEEWLNHSLFETHCSLYQQLPILWHLASSQASREPAFSCIVHAHRFDADALAKLRSVYVRERIGTLRREAAHAGQDGKESERLDLLAAAEEVEAFDAKLKRLQEGTCDGPDGGDRDYRILTPWKDAPRGPTPWNPDLDDGIKVNIAPLARTGLLRTKATFGAAEPEE